jgi:hypothetical protein
MSSTFQSINQRIIDDLRKSRSETPTEQVPTAIPAKRDADEDVPFEAPEDDS